MSQLNQYKSQKKLQNLKDDKKNLFQQQQQPTSSSQYSLHGKQDMKINKDPEMKIQQAESMKRLMNRKEISLNEISQGRKAMELIQYTEGSKDFAASAEAIGMQYSNGNHSYHLKYDHDFNMMSHLEGDPLNYPKLSGDLDEDALDSPRTSKLLAIRENQSSIANSSNLLFGEGETSELTYPHNQQKKFRVSHESSESNQAQQQSIGSRLILNNKQDERFLAGLHNIQSVEEIKNNQGLELIDDQNSYNKKEHQKRSSKQQYQQNNQQIFEDYANEDFMDDLDDQDITEINQIDLELMMHQNMQQEDAIDQMIRSKINNKIQNKKEFSKETKLKQIGLDSNQFSGQESKFQGLEDNFMIGASDSGHNSNQNSIVKLQKRKQQQQFQKQKDQNKSKDLNKKTQQKKNSQDSFQQLSEVDDLQSNEINLNDTKIRKQLQSELIDEQGPIRESDKFNLNQMMDKIQHQYQQQQIKIELKDLLEQSSSEQLLALGLQDQDFDFDDDDNFQNNQIPKTTFLDQVEIEDQQDSQFIKSSDFQENAQKMINQKINNQTQNNNFFIGEQPIDIINQFYLQNENFEDSSKHEHKKQKGKDIIDYMELHQNQFDQNEMIEFYNQENEQPQQLKLNGGNNQHKSNEIDQKKGLQQVFQQAPKQEKNKKQKDPDKQAIDSNAVPQEGVNGDENDSFHRLYNKEIKVNQDEIPLLLLELTDIAFKFIKKDQYEKAYVLLQKTESVLEVVNLEHSKRDKYFAYITYHNMAMCFQKLGMLEECIIYLKETIQVIEKNNFFKDVSISVRMRQTHMKCQLKLQLCAILSQTQKHTEAMENAKMSVRLSHQILRDMYDLCVFYSNKIKFKDDFASLSLLIMDDIDIDNDKKQEKSDKNIDRKHTKSEINEKMMQKQFVRENSPVRDIPYNILEESISMIERTALKLLPIMKELGNRLAGTQGKKGLHAFHNSQDNLKQNLKEDINKKIMKEKNKILNNDINSSFEQFEENENGQNLQKEGELKDIQDAQIEVKGQSDESQNNGIKSQEKSKQQVIEDQVDMRTILGFLNQNEWILNLNIGNIMQIQPVRMRDFLQLTRNEQQLSRESFLEKLQLLIVSYFCVSTEMRFIIQSRSGFMKADIKKEKELEQEYWHVKALDIACAFLPSECPLFNHILLSYQKHHDPTMQQIEEDKEQSDEIKVLRPLKGIENSKYQPMVRELHNINIEVADIPMSPLSKCFDKRLLPIKKKTVSINLQTDPTVQPQPPVMHSQSIGVQEDLKFLEQDDLTKNKKKQSSKQTSETINEIFDVGNVYQDLSNSKYQDSLITKIIQDPKINDKSQFLSNLLQKLQSKDQDQFFLSTSQLKQNHFAIQNTSSQAAKNIAQNTQSQNLNIYQKLLFDQNLEEKNKKQTLNNDKNQYNNSNQSESEKVDFVYGNEAKLNKNQSNIGKNKGNKKTQSGQIVYKNKKGSNMKKVQNFENLGDFNSFDQKSVKDKKENHVRSLYGDSDDRRVKHQIASQSLAPSLSVISSVDNQNVPNKRKAAASYLNHGKQMIASHQVLHKKNQSISGDNSNGLLYDDPQFIIHGHVSQTNDNFQNVLTYQDGTNKQTIDTSNNTFYQNNKHLAQNFINSVNNSSINESASGTFMKQKEINYLNNQKQSELNKNLNNSENIISGSVLQKRNFKIVNEKQLQNINLANQSNQKSNKRPNKYIPNYYYQPADQIQEQRDEQKYGQEHQKTKDQMNTSQTDINQKSKQRKTGELKKNDQNQKHEYLGAKRDINNQARNGGYTIINKEKQIIREDSLINGINDVMSTSSQGSNIDPDLHTEPQSTSRYSESNASQLKNQDQQKQLSNMQNIQEQDHQQTKTQNNRVQRDNLIKNRGTESGPQRVVASNPRASSEFTNYTSGQSAIKTRAQKQKLHGIINNNIANFKNLQKKEKKNYTILQTKNQQKQIKQLNNNSSDFSQKEKVFSRKKYGSDGSSNESPENLSKGKKNKKSSNKVEIRGLASAESAGSHFNNLASNSVLVNQSQLSHINHGYSIAGPNHQPLSIFDSANTHSTSKMSSSFLLHKQQQQQFLQQSRQSLGNQINNNNSDLSIQIASNQNLKQNQQQLNFHQQMLFNYQQDIPKMKDQKKQQFNQNNEILNLQMKTNEMEHKTLNKVENKNAQVKNDGKIIQKAVERKGQLTSKQNADRRISREEQIQKGEIRQKSKRGKTFTQTLYQRDISKIAAAEGKSANSIPSLCARSNNKLSKYSQNSKQLSNTKSRIQSKSKSSAKSGDKTLKSISNDRKQLNLKNQNLQYLKNYSKQSEEGTIQNLNNNLNQNKNMQNKQIYKVTEQENQFQMQDNIEKNVQMHGQLSDLLQEGRQNNITKMNEVKYKQQRPKSSMINLQKPPNPDYFTQHFKMDQDQANDQFAAFIKKENKQKKLQKRNLEQQPVVNKVHNSSIENLQRQVLENQKILLSNMVKPQKQQKSQKRINQKYPEFQYPSKNGNDIQINQKYHNHNNSISQMNNLGVIDNDIQIGLIQQFSQNKKNYNNLEFSTTQGVIRQNDQNQFLNEDKEFDILYQKRNNNKNTLIKNQQIQRNNSILNQQLSKNQIKEGAFKVRDSSKNYKKKKQQGQRQTTVSRLQQQNMNNNNFKSQTDQMQINDNLNQLEQFLVQSRHQNQNIINSQNNSQIINSIGQKKENIQNIKLTNPNLTTNLRNNLTNIAIAGSTSASTNGASGQYVSGKNNKKRQTGANNDRQQSIKRKGSITTANGALQQVLQSKQQLPNQQNLKNYHQQRYEGQFLNFDQLQKLSVLENGMSHSFLNNEIGNNQKLSEEEELQHSNSQMLSRTIPQILVDEQIIFEKERNMGQKEERKERKSIDKKNSEHQPHFIPHKNMLPKTTGSQAQLLKYHYSNNNNLSNPKQYNSLNHISKSKK